MLKQRILTAAVLVPAVLAALFALPNDWFALVMAAVVLIGAWEWGGLMGLEASVARTGVCAGYVALGALAYLFDWAWLAPAAVIFWFLASYWVARYPDNERQWHRGAWALGVIGVFVLVPAWWALVHLQGVAAGPGWLLYAMGLVWAADSAAYFAGRRWGRRKLAPEVSPGKSVEGLLGGLAAVLALASVLAVVRGLSLGEGLALAGVSVLTMVAALFGDLFESMLKRARGVKDSGTILPGHGGLLDRIDSLTAALPVFAACWSLPGVRLWA